MNLRSAAAVGDLDPPVLTRFLTLSQRYLLHSRIVVDERGVLRVECAAADRLQRDIRCNETPCIAIGARPGRLPCVA